MAFKQHYGCCHTLHRYVISSTQNGSTLHFDENDSFMFVAKWPFCNLIWTTAIRICWKNYPPAQRYNFFFFPLLYTHCQHSVGKCILRLYAYFWVASTFFLVVVVFPFAMEKDERRREVCTICTFSVFIVDSLNLAHKNQTKASKRILYDTFHSFFRSLSLVLWKISLSVVAVF